MSLSNVHLRWITGPGPEASGSALKGRVGPCECTVTHHNVEPFVRIRPALGSTPGSGRVSNAKRGAVQTLNGPPDNASAGHEFPLPRVSPNAVSGESGTAGVDSDRRRGPQIGSKALEAYRACCRKRPFIGRPVRWCWRASASLPEPKAACPISSRPQSNGYARRSEA